MVELLSLYVQLFTTIVGIFGICEFGERISFAFYKINIALDRFKWYRLPKEVQKMLPIIMIAAQEPVQLNIFGSVACNRITFKEVSRFIHSWLPVYYWSWLIFVLFFSSDVSLSIFVGHVTSSQHKFNHFTIKKYNW